MESSTKQLADDLLGCLCIARLGMKLDGLSEDDQQRAQACSKDVNCLRRLRLALEQRCRIGPPLQPVKQLLAELEEYRRYLSLEDYSDRTILYGPPAISRDDVFQHRLIRVRASEISHSLCNTRVRLFTAAFALLAAVRSGELVPQSGRTV